MKKAALSYLVKPEVEIAVWMTPNASGNVLLEEDEKLRIYVTATPVDGKANKAAAKLLAKALAVPKSRLALIRGKTAREKVFRIA